LSRRVARVVMVQGCTSHAGKSYLAAALCRIFANRGIRVAPFKAQNMSNNAGVTADGLEMGRAQIVQAAACRLAPEVRMNPSLLKPESDGRAQSVLLGRPDYGAADLPWHDRRDRFWPPIAASLHSLLDEFEVVVIEGAGSPAEINLRRSDLVNMEIALEAQRYGAETSVLLVSDIDRGGSFAHLLGTVECLAAEERALIRGFVLNKFRGDPALIHPAPEWLERRTGIPTVGVVPMLDIQLPEEDGVSIESSVTSVGLVGVISLPRISNLDEFAPLGDLVRIVRRPADLGGVRAIVIPGSKATIADLGWLRSTGLAAAIHRAARAGIPVMGVCGGLQMLGATIVDVDGVEGAAGSVANGLGLLDLATTLSADKVVVVAVFDDRSLGVALHGYEIHAGRSTTSLPAFLFRDEVPVGWRDGNVTGVYAHGLLDNAAFTESFCGTSGLPVPAQIDSLDIRLDRLAAAVEPCLDRSLLMPC
jgi:adenosylcobyric acid synthase